MSRISGSGEYTVLVDMDGVMAEYEEPNNTIIKTHFPEVLPIVNREEFYFSDTYRTLDNVVETIDTQIRLPGFIRSLPVVDGAIYGWQRIMDKGYIPRVCSSPLKNHETIVVEKIDWLEEFFVPRFGSWVIDTAIFDRDKSGYDAVAIIDDRPSLRNIDKAMWQHIVFSRSYNKQVDTEFRLDDWYDPNLEELLDKAREKYLAISNRA